jgi:hypothetical protein
MMPEIGGTGTMAKMTALRPAVLEKAFVIDVIEMIDPMKGFLVLGEVLTVLKWSAQMTEDLVPSLRKISSGCETTFRLMSPTPGSHHLATS